MILASRFLPCRRPILDSRAVVAASCPFGSQKAPFINNPKVSRCTKFTLTCLRAPPPSQVRKARSFQTFASCSIFHKVKYVQRHSCGNENFMMEAKLAGLLPGQWQHPSQPGQHPALSGCLSAVGLQTMLNCSAWFRKIKKKKVTSENVKLLINE